MNLYNDIYAVVKQIPRGSVTSYGRIAKMVNCTARQVGYAMAATPPDQGIPWHRVINSKGEISARKGGGGDNRQKRKLLDEGVVFDPKGRVDFARFGWVEAERELELELDLEQNQDHDRHELAWPLPPEEEW